MQKTPTFVCCLVLFLPACGDDAGVLPLPEGPDLAAGDRAQAADDLGPALDQAQPDLNPCPSLNLSSGQPSEPTCMAEQFVCRYFEAMLICRGGRWEYCWSGQPLQCPRDEPQDGKTCDGACRSFPCPYACAGGVARTCTCDLNRWSCVTTPCVLDGGVKDGG